ncbi:MAG TPA: glutathione S-transferase family protein [Beijerinckiaceae bacterium]|nr:glutathione S-transferase family protein [Beijerinckiaceae bacterium]
MIVLHGSGGSPYVTRVVMQAAAKNIDLELRPANLADPEFRRMNPIGKMPVLEHDGFVLPESYVICEYLEDVFPTPSLRGASAHDRARVRLIARVVDLYCAGIFPILRAAADPTFTIEASERATLDKGLDALDTFLSGDGWAVGGAMSLADCALATWLYYGNKLTRGGDDALTKRPKLARYVAFVSDQPLVQKVQAEMDEAFRAFMARWKAEQAAMNAST